MKLLQPQLLRIKTELTTDVQSRESCRVLLSTTILCLDLILFPEIHAH